MKICVLSILLLAVVGCSQEVRIEPELIQKQAEVCDTNEGLEGIVVVSFIDDIGHMESRIECKNGASFALRVKYK